jgi:hypothetical protein
MKIALLLRGHVRDSLFSNDLHDFVKTLYDLYSVDMYIHTWNVVSSGKTHREIRENLVPVTDLVLHNYFGDIECKKKFIIEDMERIELVGSWGGFVCETGQPKQAWKNYWYGQWRLINAVQDMGYDYVINMRFDLLEFERYQLYKRIGFLSDSVEEKFLVEDVLKRISAGLASGRILLRHDGLQFGIDNCMIGGPAFMMTLISKFHFELDAICSRWPDVTSHEFLVFHVNETLL